MKRPPFNRHKRRNKKRKDSTSGSAPRLKGKLRTLLFVVVGISLVQYLNTGSVTWPGDTFRALTGKVGDYAQRPEAGWRQATEALETIGARKEGQPTPDFDLVGRVVRVADGDTVSILDQSNRQHKVRLYGIDTPERDQPFGLAARKALARRVADKKVGVVIVETDNYGRTVGTVYLDAMNINVAMVADGYAWWYRFYAPNNPELAASEKAARSQAIGLWSESRPIPPWDWRRGRR